MLVQPFESGIFGRSRLQHSVAASQATLSAWQRLQPSRRRSGYASFSPTSDTPPTPSASRATTKELDSLLNHPITYARSKAIDVLHDLTRERVECGEVDLTYCPTDEMGADCFTKQFQSALTRCAKQGTAVLQVGARRRAPAVFQNQGRSTQDSTIVTFQRTIALHAVLETDLPAWEC